MSVPNPDRFFSFSKDPLLLSCAAHDPTFQKELEMLKDTESLVETPNFFQGNK